MSVQKEKKMRNQNLTVPNALSVLRILLIPFFAYFYAEDNLPAAIVVLGLSGLSDAVDGYIARRFNQITELGKLLDPFADKLTQGTVAVCVAIRFPNAGILLGLLVVKELTMLCGAMYLFKRKKKPCAAKWYGKASTTLFYVSIALIVVLDGFFDLPLHTFNLVANGALVITAGFMIYSFIRYFGVFREILRSESGEYDMNLPAEIRARKSREELPPAE